jgi:hypothetical protein
MLLYEYNSLQVNKNLDIIKLLFAKGRETKKFTYSIINTLDFNLKLYISYFVLLLLLYFTS